MINIIGSRLYGNTAILYLLILKYINTGVLQVISLSTFVTLYYSGCIEYPEAIRELISVRLYYGFTGHRLLRIFHNISEVSKYRHWKSLSVKIYSNNIVVSKNFYVILPLYTLSSFISDQLLQPQKQRLWELACYRSWYSNVMIQTTNYSYS